MTLRIIKNYQITEKNSPRMIITREKLSCAQVPAAGVDGGGSYEEAKSRGILPK